MAELLHADTIQQLEVALLGSPVAQLLKVLATGIMCPASTLQQQAIHPPKAYPMTPVVPPPCTIHIAGVTDSSMSVVASSRSKVTTPASQEIEEIPPKHCQISPTPFPSLK